MSCLELILPKIHIWNGKGSADNRMLDGSTYHSKKPVASSLLQKKISCKDVQQLALKIGNAI